MIKNKRINGITPTERYNDGKKVIKTYNNGIIVWDITGNEYLKVYESYIGEKFLESYETQSVLTSVYWVHQVDGQIVETYLSTSELQSWECETLEPYYYTDGNRQYVGYYQLPPGRSFGQHDMKITYKSPDTNEILEVEYPIYYLEEKSFSLPFDSYDWYPFRNPFAFYSIGDSIVLYQCTDKQGNLIEEEYSVNTSITEMAFYFPKVDNAQYKFGENQNVDVYYISQALKEYHVNLIVNIRPYYDIRNMECNYSGTSTAINKYYYKNLRPMKITIDLSKKTYFGNLVVKQAENGYDETADIYQVGTLDMLAYLNNDEIYLYNSVDQIGEIFVKKGQYFQSKSIDITELGGNYNNTNTWFQNNTSKFNNFSIGFAYWGDGTFSQVVITNYFYNQNTVFANTTGRVSKENFDTLKIRNGYALDGKSKVYNYTNPLLDCNHTYDAYQEYTIELTCCYSCSDYYSDGVPYAQFSFKGGDMAITTYGRIVKNCETYTEYFEKCNQENGVIMKYARMPTESLLNRVTKLDFGDTSIFGFAKKSSGYNVNSGYEDLYKFQLENRLLTSLCNLESLSIPKVSKDAISYSYWYVATYTFPCEIQCDGSVSDFDNLSDYAKASLRNNFKEWQDLKTSNRIKSVDFIKCKDGNVDLENL